MKKQELNHQRRRDLKQGNSFGVEPKEYTKEYGGDLGLQQHRLDGDDYLAVIGEFMEAVFTRWPNVIVQFEDFQSKWAFKLLQRYRTTYRMFNDDVQGTAGVAIAGLLGAVRAQGRPMIDFPKQKIVVAGAASAGIGVLNSARKTMARMLGNNEVAFQSAKGQFWVVDAKNNVWVTWGKIEKTERKVIFRLQIHATHADGSYLFSLDIIPKLCQLAQEHVKSMRE